MNIAISECNSLKSVNTVMAVPSPLIAIMRIFTEAEVLQRIRIFDWFPIFSLALVTRITLFF